MRKAANGPSYSFGCISWHAPYHGELGLELDFQVLKRAPQVGDLALAGLKLFRVAADLLPELPALPQQRGVRGRESALLPFNTSVSTPFVFVSSTFSMNQASASFRFCSAMVSYCARMSLRSLVRSTPGAASISTLTWPGPPARQLWSSWGKAGERGEGAHCDFHAPLHRQKIGNITFDYCVGLNTNQLIQTIQTSFI